jgi:hypothetical protein
LLQDAPAAPKSLGSIANVVAKPEGEWINVVDVIGRTLIDDDPDKFKDQEFCVSVRQRGRYHDGMNAINTVALRGAEGGRHMSIGAYEEGKTEEHHPCVVPYVVLDVDRHDIVESREATNRLLEGLDAEFGNIHAIVCATGGRGFHVQIPMGAFGKPVFKNRQAARQALSRWADEYLEEEVDTELFDPRHLYRMVGSKHEKTGY